MNFIKSITIDPNTPATKYDIFDFSDDKKRVLKLLFINDFNNIFNLYIDDQMIQSRLIDKNTFEFTSGIKKLSVEPLDSSTEYIHMFFLVEEWGN